MHDPLEGITPSGTIRTGASRDRVASSFRPILETAVELVGGGGPHVSLYLYGSVATGMAQPGTSDVDLLAVGLPADIAANIARELSEEFITLGRAVEIGAAQATDFSADTDEGYGGRVFLKHYCVHLAGPDLHSDLPEFPADIRAARGFNGDIAAHAARWRTELEDGANPAALGRRLARKTLLAVAGLVSIHDGTWTTDRVTAAARWGEIEPSLEGELHTLVTWSRGNAPPDGEAVGAALRGVVVRITSSFERSIGLWGSSGSE